MSTDNAIDRIKTLWATEGIPIRPGNSPEALAAFEAKYHVVLTSAVRDYFATVDGTGDMSDNAFIRFWPLAEVAPILEFHRWEPAEAPEYVGWFYFADFMIQSHEFAIHLTPDVDDGGQVAFVCGGLYPLASSFAVFLDHYLTDRDSLYCCIPPVEE